MRAFRNLLLALLFLALLIALGAGAFLTPPGQEYLRSRLVVWASGQLGRELAIDRLAIAPGLRHFGLTADGLRLANTTWGSEPAMLSARRVAVDVDAVSLLADTLIVHSITAEGLKLLLERTAEGDQNWDFALPPRKGGESWQGTLPVVIDSVTIPGAHLRFIGPRLERPLEVELATLQQRRAPGDMLALTARGEVNGTDLALDGSIGPFAALVTAKDFRVALRGRLGELMLTADLRVDDLAKPIDTAATLHLQGPGAAYLASRFGVRNLGDGPLDLAATLARAADGKGVSGAVTGKIGSFSINADVALADPAHMGRLDVDANISGPDLSLLGGIAGVDRLPTESFTLSTKLRRSGQALHIEDAELTVAGAELRAEGTIGRLDEFSDTTLRVQARGADIARLRALLRIPGVATGAFEVAGTVKPENSGVELVDFVVSTSAGSASVNGNLGAGPEFFGTHLNFSVSGPDFTAVARAAGLKNPPAGAYQASGDIRWTSAGAVLSGCALQIGGDGLKLDGRLGRPPRFDGSSLKFGLTGKNLSAIAAHFGLEGLPKAEYQASGAWRREKGRDGIDDLVISTAGARLEAVGVLSLVGPSNTADVKLRLEGSDLAPFAGLARGYALPPGPFGASAEIKLANDTVSVSGLSFSAARASGTGSAEIGLAPGSQPLRLRLAVRGPDLHALVPDLPVKYAGAQAFDLAGDVVWRPGRWSFSHVRFGIAEARLELDGDLDQNSSLSGTALELQVPSAAKTGELFGLALPALPLDLAATLSGTPRALHAGNISARLGDSDVSGDIAFKLQKRPELSIDLRSGMLDLQPFLSTAKAPLKDVKASLIPDWRLPLDWLGRANARFSLQAGKVKFRSGDYENLDLKATLTDGRLSADPIALEGDGGRFSARLQISSTDSPPKVHLTATGHAIPFSVLASAERGGQASRYEADIDLRGAGTSVRDILGDASGHIRLSGTGGRISGTALNSFSGDFLTELLTKINPFVKRQPYTDLICQAVLFRADAGTLRTDPALVLRTNQVDVISQGTVDLKTEKIDFTFKTAARSGLGISAADLVNPYIKVSGTLADPRIGVNTKGTIVSGGAAVATGGLSILAVAAWDRIFREKDPCAAAVRQSQKEKRRR